MICWLCTYISYVLGHNKLQPGDENNPNIRRYLQSYNFIYTEIDVYDIYWLDVIYILPHTEIYWLKKI